MNSTEGLIGCWDTFVFTPSISLSQRKVWEMLASSSCSWSTSNRSIHKFPRKIASALTMPFWSFVKRFGKLPNVDDIILRYLRAVKIGSQQNMDDFDQMLEHVEDVWVKCRYSLRCASCMLDKERRQRAIAKKENGDAPAIERDEPLQVSQISFNITGNCRICWEMGSLLDSGRG